MPACFEEAMRTLRSRSHTMKLYEASGDLADALTDHLEVTMMNRTFMTCSVCEQENCWGLGPCEAAKGDLIYALGGGTYP
jgi:hypothetical protein